ncbi:uncharacterized protein LOC133530774 [Cydia pomonella]|uniref:uncharacterized protein LOC133530774 n=1 Tax=Cydia pomonella TaxID=82600 RepID=UPI002ADD4E6B|nr:uncharacterized protein LOC133530774 [Cydia pomonella]
MAHRPHFLLRAPLHATYEQTRAVLAGVLRGLGGLRAEELLAAQDVVRHVDHNGVELWHGAEPLVKAEPPAAAADPLRGADEHDAYPLRGADEHDADPLRGADEHDSDREDPDYRACLDALRTETLPNLPSHRDGQDY